MKRFLVACSLTGVCASCVFATDFDSFTSPDAGLPAVSDSSVEAAIQDSGVDSTVLEAAADASSSRFCPGDASPRLANAMRCDVPTCQVGKQGCCIVYGNQADYCYDLATEKCTAMDMTNAIGDFLCDDTRDCPDGQFCCANVSQSGPTTLLTQARCAASCGDRQVMLCDPADGCPGCKACSFFDTPSQRYFSCAP